ncbi:Epididymal secretory protein E3-beta [Myotis brandtii]|uniref:Epididymal secretory protein E3-beta n=1 Tax=Myotis brandtii TaxID=109478 RepID=S7MNK7_MYOBR|nr:Epididymal secretory protein E3-beta [Myotis brandtii]
MKQHHLSTSWEFNEYRCNDLMREREAPKDRNYHLFIYIFWHKIEHICIRNWRDYYRNIEHPERRIIVFFISAVFVSKTVTDT